MAKRKNTTLKKVIAKNKQVYYYKNGKRISAEHGKRIEAQTFAKRSEAAKKAAANTYKYQGRPIPRIYAKLLSKIYPNLELLKTMDLSKWKDPKTGKPLFPRFSDIQKNIDNASKSDSDIFRLLTEMGYFQGKEGRTALIDICEIILQKEYDKFKFILIDEDGNETRGRVAMCNALRQFEEFVTTDIRAAIGMNVIKTYFDYSPNYDFSKKIFKVDVTDLNPKISIEEIVNRGVDKNNTLTQVKGELTFPDKIISDETGEAIPVTPKSIVGKNKYKNVYITFSVS
jgi:hypothetical protein